MSKKQCDNFGEYFIYRLENLLTRDIRKKEFKDLISKSIRKHEDSIKSEFNYYIDAKSKSLAENNGKSKFMNFFLEGWRPIMMYLFMYLIAQYYVINPLLELLYPSLRLKDLPTEMWTLLTVAVGGYITSRGVEKGIHMWRNNENTNRTIIIGDNFDNSPNQEIQPNQGGYIDDEYYANNGENLENNEENII
jgi:hypothetical protein